MASVSPVIELHASIIRDLISRGNKITVYLLDRSFKSPTENPFNRKSIFNFSVFRARDAIYGLTINFKFINLINVEEDVSSVTFEALDIGVMSSFASSTKAQNKEQLNKKWRKAYNNMLNSSKKLYNYFTDEIKKENYDFVFMFNGRFGCVKPVLEATRNLGVGFGLVEVKKTINEVVFVNELVHSIDANTNKALLFYENNKKEAVEKAEEFFSKKIKNENTGDPIYTKDQQLNYLTPSIVNTNKKIVAIYPSTEDEYKFIGKEWDGHVPESQVEEIEKLAVSLPENEYLLVVKMHPNQANSAEHTLLLYNKLASKYKNIIVEPPLSMVDSYALMKKSSVVVTFASTIGVEACYAGKPVVLIGDTTWSKMNVAYKVYSGSEAGDVIKKGLNPKPKEGAIIWGYYLSCYKDELPSYKMVGNGDYYVDGRKIGKSVWMRILQLPAKFEIEISKPGFKFSKDFILRSKHIISNIIKGKWTIR